ncbi:BON domain-containing protein [Nitrospira sp. Nam74]
MEKQHVQVEVSQGIVTLKGSVDTLAQSLAAEHAAKEIRGLADVINMRYRVLAVKSKKTSSSTRNRRPW